MQKNVSVDLKEGAILVKIQVEAEGQGKLALEASVELVKVLEMLAAKTKSEYDDKAVEMLKSLVEALDK